MVDEDPTGIQAAVRRRRRLSNSIRGAGKRREG